MRWFPLLLTLLACQRSDPPAESNASRRSDDARAQSPVELPGEAELLKSKSNGTPHDDLPFARTTLGGRDDEPLPWIVAIHGLGDTPEAFVGLLDGVPLRAHVLAPRALYPYGRGFDWFRQRVTGDPERLAEAVNDAAERLVKWIDVRAREEQNVGRPVVLGFSQGGILTFALAVQHPEVFRAAAALGGQLPRPLWPSTKPNVALPLLALHGSDDRTVPVAPTRALTAHLDELGYQVVLLEFPGVAHRVPLEMQTRLVDFIARELDQ
jgi:phospholipase/carboxylesterase